MYYREDDEEDKKKTCKDVRADAEGEIVGCPEDCARRHPAKALCLVCGEAWREHSGHTCPGMTGTRGSWAMRYDELYPSRLQAADEPDLQICGMCFGMAFVLALLVFVVIAIVIVFGTMGGRAPKVTLEHTMADLP